MHANSNNSRRVCITISIVVLLDWIEMRSMVSCSIHSSFCIVYTQAFFNTNCTFPVYQKLKETLNSQISQIIQKNYVNALNSSLPYFGIFLSVFYLMLFWVIFQYLETFYFRKYYCTNMTGNIIFDNFHFLSATWVSWNFQHFIFRMS